MNLYEFLTTVIKKSQKFNIKKLQKDSFIKSSEGTQVSEIPILAQKKEKKE